MKIKKLITYKRVMVTAIVSQAILVSSAFAGAPTTALEVKGVLDRIAKDLALIFGALAIVVIIYAAYVYLTAGGNAARVETAKKTLIFAVVAIVLAALASGIPSVVEQIICNGPC